MHAAQPIHNLEMNWPLRLDVFHQGRRGKRREVSRGSVLRELIITLPIEIITNGYAAIKRLAEEKLSLVIGDGQN